MINWDVIEKLCKISGGHYFKTEGDDTCYVCKTTFFIKTTFFVNEPSERMENRTATARKRYNFELGNKGLLREVQNGIIN